MQFLIMNGSVECPACGVSLTLKREQDRRVATMEHSKAGTCSCSGQLFRVDRRSGYGEITYDA